MGLCAGEPGKRGAGAANSVTRCGTSGAAPCPARQLTGCIAGAGMPPHGRALHAGLAPVSLLSGQVKSSLEGWLCLGPAAMLGYHGQACLTVGRSLHTLQFLSRRARAGLEQCMQAWYPNADPRSAVRWNTFGCN